MRARNGRDRRARRGRYYLRDLAGFAGIERLLAKRVGGERRFPDVADDDASTDVMRRRPVSRSREAVCEGDGEHL